MSWSVLGYCWSWGSLYHCKTESVQVERLQYVPRAEHRGSEVQELTRGEGETKRHGSGMAAKAGEPNPEYLDALWQSLLSRVRRYGFSRSSLSPKPFSFPSVPVLGSVALPSLRRALCGGGPGVIWVSGLEEWPQNSGHLSLGRWVVWKREGSLPSRQGVG